MTQMLTLPEEDYRRGLVADIRRDANGRTLSSADVAAWVYRHRAHGQADYKPNTRDRAIAEWCAVAVDFAQTYDLPIR